MNQRANSVADLAAVLLQAEKGPSEDRIKYKERSKQHWEKVRKQKEAAGKRFRDGSQGVRRRRMGWRGS